MAWLKSKITPCLWFEKDGEKAVDFYVETFKRLGHDAAVKRILHYGKAGPMPEGSVLTVEWQMAGQDFILVNGGPWAKPSAAVSFFLLCKDQKEVDGFWEAFSADGGEPGQCGWITDRFGFTWQVVPEVMERMIHDPDPEKVERVMRAMFPMVKLDAATLEAAFKG